MNDHELEQLRQALQLAQENFKSEARLRRQAQAELRAVVDEVLAMAYLLLGEDLAAGVSREEMPSLRQLPPVEAVRRGKMLAYEKMARLQAEHEGHEEEVVPGVSPDEVARLEAEVAALRGQVARLEGEKSDLERRLRAAEARVAVGRETTPPEQEPPAMSADPELLEKARELLEEGQVDEKVQALVKLLGEGEECRRREVEAILAAEYGVTPGGTMQRLFKRAEKHGLVESVRPKAEISGRATALLRLTPLGLALAGLLLGHDPAEPLLDRLLARHKSPEHVLLNLEAADLLRAAGGEVDLFPAPVTLAGGGILDVDLLWLVDGQVRYVECERHTRKDAPRRAVKWANLAEATEDFWIVTPDPTAQKALISELTVWALRGHYKITLHVTNLARASPEKPWLYERRF